MWNAAPPRVISFGIFVTYIYSCQSLLVKFTDDWTKSLDKNHIVGAVSMDLFKGFDSLPHSLLISKLNAYGLSISACNLMASYLQDWKQRVKLGPVRSTWSNLTKGSHKDVSSPCTFLTYLWMICFTWLKNVLSTIMQMIIPCQMHLPKLTRLC